MLTQKEHEFINALYSNYNQKRNNSFMHILFCSCPDKQNNLMKNALNGVYNKKHRKIIQKSDIIFRTQDSFYLGKYKNDFFIYGNEGELFGAGKEIQNTCNVFIELFYTYDINDKRALNNIFKMHDYPPYENVINEYKIFCKQFNLEYNENDLYWQKQAEDFDNFIFSLE